MMSEFMEKKCLLCEDEQQIKELYKANFTMEDFNTEVFSARRNTKKCHYRIVKCDCGMVFSTPILPFDKISVLYKDSDLTYGEEIENIANSYYQVFKTVTNKKNNDFKVLEFGCGNGFFLKKLYDEGFTNVFGVEPSDKAVALAHKDISQNITKGFIEDLPEHNQFDVICAFQTLDHLYNPIDNLKKCYNLCAEGGKFFAVIHNTQGFQAKLLKDKSPIIDIEHIYLFNKSTAKQTLTKAGFNNVKAFDIKNTYSLKYWMSMLPLPPFIRNCALQTLKLLHADKIKITIKAGNIVVYGEK